ncbi:ABC transporter substrate-binding protein [Alloalcanivorax mobilis]|uniref:ABC transporter substrate-binding protein n=1 Tax=Alloalcanivorax mobilis TaxID=2019569 RepID=UPI000C78A475|nr:ABC transporter substrate-binding protein [Alloalcanivorax mobilis]
MFAASRRRIRLVLILMLLPLTFTARADDITLRVGYIPIMPMAQLFVMDGAGWTDDAGLNLKLTRFSSGPAMVQALASGTLDVAYIGIGPAMVSKAKGVPIKVVAANVYNQMAVIARGDFAKAWQAEPGANAVKAFEKAQQRKLKIATLPKGSVPDTVLHYWVEKQLGLKPDQVEIIGMGATAVQQALLAGSVDAASIMEPVLTVAGERLPDAKVIARGDDMMPQHPGAVVAVTEQALDAHPQEIRKLVALHARATDLLNNHPEQAAPYLADFIGKGLLPEALLQRALQAEQGHFVAAPRQLLEGTKRLNEYQQAIGVGRGELDVDALFDDDFYNKATAKQ